MLIHTWKKTKQTNQKTKTPKKQLSPWKNRYKTNLAGNSQSLLRKFSFHPPIKISSRCLVTPSCYLEKLINYGELNLLSLPHSSWMIIACTSGFWTIQWMSLKPWSHDLQLGCVQRAAGAWAVKFCIHIQRVRKGGSHSCVGKGSRSCFSLTSQIHEQIMWDTNNPHRDNFLSIFLTLPFGPPFSLQNETGSDRVICKLCEVYKMLSYLDSNLLSHF